MSEIKKNGDKAVIKPNQDIVASTATDFKVELKSVIDGGAKQMQVDLGDVKMIDSSGLGVLIAAHNSLQKIGEKLELVNVSDDILKLLQNMRLDKHFDIK